MNASLILNSQLHTFAWPSTTQIFDNTRYFFDIPKSVNNTIKINLDKNYIIIDDLLYSATVRNNVIYLGKTHNLYVSNYYTDDIDVVIIAPELIQITSASKVSVLSIDLVVHTNKEKHAIKSFVPIYGLVQMIFVNQKVYIYVNDDVYLAERYGKIKQFGDDVTVWIIDPKDQSDVRQQLYLYPELV